MPGKARVLSRWSRLVNSNQIASFFDISQAEPDDCWMLLADYCEVGACITDFANPAHFPSAQDALAFLRCYQIPAMLRWKTHEDQEQPLTPAEDYLPLLEEGHRAAIATLLPLLDKAIGSTNLEPAAVQQVMDRFNTVFFWERSNPACQVEACGELEDFLPALFSIARNWEQEERAENAEWLAENGLEEDDSSEELEPWLGLEELLETGAFRRDDVDHFQLALGFIESQARC